VFHTLKKERFVQEKGLTSRAVLFRSFIPHITESPISDKEWKKAVKHYKKEEMSRCKPVYFSC
jgi:hypothetical protein